VLQNARSFYTSIAFTRIGVKINLMEKFGTLQIIGSLILILGGIAGIFWYFTKQMEKTFDVFTKQIEERFKIFTDNIEKRFGRCQLLALIDWAG
jgi:hypothetical protein